MPMAPVSPSPLMPMAISLWFASTAPVATDGMRPCTELKPWDEPRKYAGLLLEQPMPDSLITWLGSMPISKNASKMRSEIALWPQPAHSVVFPPLYDCGSRPIRLTLCVDMTSLPAQHRGGALGRLPSHLVPFARQHRIGHAARVDGQPVVVQDAAQLAHALR
jgi:hypothetical protein